MAYDPHKHHRRSIRLKGYDYSQDGIYFVTICVKNGLCLFGDVVNEEMILSPAGEMVEQAWLELPDRFPQVELDVFRAMPNHFHGLMGIRNANLHSEDRATTRVAPTTVDLVDDMVRAGLVPAQDGVVLGDMVGAFKSITTNEYITAVQESGWEPFPGKLWQRNFYEQIIRNERHLTAVRQYIHDNPANWEPDKLYPQAQPNKFNQLWRSEEKK